MMWEGRWKPRLMGYPNQWGAIPEEAMGTQRLQNQEKLYGQLCLLTLLGDCLVWFLQERIHFS